MRLKKLIPGEMDREWSNDTHVVDGSVRPCRPFKEEFNAAKVEDEKQKARTATESQRGSIFRLRLKT